MMTLIEKYLRYLRYERNYSSHTEISYSKDLHQFADFLKERHPDVDLRTVDGDVVRLWVVALVEAKVSPRSVNRKLSALKSFYRYLLRVGEVSSSPMKKVVGPKAKKTIPAFIKTIDIERILNDEDFEDSFNSFRNHLMLELFYVTGIRRAELIGIKDVDVDFDAKTVRVTGKRNKQRLIPLSDNILSEIEEYIDKRDEELDAFSGYLFIKEDGEPLYPMLVHRIVSDTLKRISTLSKTSPHVLRHTFATDMLNNGADINAVKELLGHSSLASTEVYTHTSFEELKKIYNKAHPRA
jgi:integrase/recombinase XerC